ncbi:MAG: DoxX family protein [Gammaproteobacteria bacterium]
MENTINRYGPLLGRILIAFIFIFAGFGKVTGFDGTVGYIASKGLPLPQLAAVAAIIIELGGGILLIAGWKARWAAVAMLLFTGIAAVIFHNFWAVPADQTQNQMIHFMKNVSMMGGLLYVAVYGSGPLSVGGNAAKAG